MGEAFSWDVLRNFLAVVGLVVWVLSVGVLGVVGQVLELLVGGVLRQMFWLMGVAVWGLFRKDLRHIIEVVFEEGVWWFEGERPRDDVPTDCQVFC